MFYFRIEATPSLENEADAETGGAFVNCWIDFKIQDGAEELARYYIKQAGWVPGETEAARWVEKEEYREMPETLVWFTEAEEDGVCLVFHSWPVGAEDETD